MFCPGCFGPSPFAFSLAALPSSLVDIVAADPADHSPGIPCRHSSLRPTFGMGRMDRVSLYHSDYGERGGDVCHAEDACQPKGTQKENSAEC